MGAEAERRREGHTTQARPASRCVQQQALHDLQNADSQADTRATTPGAAFLSPLIAAGGAAWRPGVQQRRRQRQSLQPYRQGLILLVTVPSVSASRCGMHFAALARSLAAAAASSAGPLALMRGATLWGDPSGRDQASCPFSSLTAPNRLSWEACEGACGPGMGDGPHVLAGALLPEARW